MYNLLTKYIQIYRVPVKILKVIYSKLNNSIIHIHLNSSETTGIFNLIPINQHFLKNHQLHKLQ